MGQCPQKRLAFLNGPSYNHLSIALAYRHRTCWPRLGHFPALHSLINVRAELNEDRLSGFEVCLPHISLSKMLRLIDRGDRTHFDLEWCTDVLSVRGWIRCENVNVLHHGQLWGHGQSCSELWSHWMNKRPLSEYVLTCLPQRNGSRMHLCQN